MMPSSGLVVDKIDWNRAGPAFLTCLSPTMRWYAMRLLWAVVPRHLLAIQTLLRASARA